KRTQVRLRDIYAQCVQTPPGVGAANAVVGGKVRVMMLRGIRSRLLGLVLATVIPFTALVALGLWSHWRNERANASERAIAEARLLAAQVEDHLGNLDALLAGLSRAVSFDPADTAANDVMLQQLKLELPGFISNIFVFAPDGSNIGIAQGARFSA